LLRGFEGKARAQQEESRSHGERDFPGFLRPEGPQKEIPAFRNFKEEKIQKKENAAKVLGISGITTQQKEAERKEHERWTRWWAPPGKQPSDYYSIDLENAKRKLRDGEETLLGAQAVLGKMTEGGH
jgi:hypothetical protein